MKTASKFRAAAILVLGSAALTACGGGGGPSYDPDSPEGMAFEFRQAVMRAAGVKMQLINNMAREQMPIDEAVFAKAAADLAVLTAMMPEGFDNETLVAESNTEAAAFQNRSDFDARMDAAIEATAALADAVETGGFAAGQALVVASAGTSSNCGGCHNTYRSRDE